MSTADIHLFHGEFLYSALDRILLSAFSFGHNVNFIIFLLSVYSQAKKTVNTRIIYGMLSCYKEKANKVWEK